MKLSDAIRLGAMLSTQSMAGMTDGKGGACALGAAALAVSIPAADSDKTYDALKAHWPILSQRVDGPTYFDDELYRVIYWLNDCSRWTREDIADWVATIEAQQPELCQPADFHEFDQRVAEPCVPVYEDANEVIA